MKVTRRQIFTRGLTNSCPNCGRHTLFREGKIFQMNPGCPKCGFHWEGEGNEGHYLRSTSLNFGVTLTCYLLPVLLVAWAGWISALMAETLALVGSFLVPVLLYRPTRSWGLMNYYIFFPEELPVNGGVNPVGSEGASPLPKSAIDQRPDNP